MKHTINVIEIMPTVYAAAAMLPGGFMIHTSLTAKSAKDAISLIKARFHAQKHHAVKAGNARWAKGDVFDVEIVHKEKKPDLFTGGAEKPAVVEPALWELVKIPGNDGSITYSAKKHERPLMTETELKLALFESTVNAE